MDKNECPYCGWECVEIVGRPYSGLGRGRCPNCQSNGPEVSPPSAALDAFCNPTYLLNKTGLIRLAADDGKRPTLNTREFVVIRRKTAETMLSTIEDQFGTDEECPETGETICDFCGYTDSEAAWFDICVALGKTGANEE